MTADARLDVREKLASEIEVATGERPGACGDAGLILRAYAAWGTRCVEHFIGDFSFALWDGKQNALFCARDHLGVKPLFYSQRGGGLAVSNTLQCLLGVGGGSCALNETAVGDFLLFGSNQDSATTFFQDIQRLPAAHALLWRGSELHLWRYWTMLAEGPLYFRDRKECVQEFRARLALAVSDRLRHSSASILLSGGMDSTSVAAVASGVLSSAGQTGKLKAFTAVYRSLFDDPEGEFARTAADALGIFQEFINGDDCALFAHAGDADFFRPEPADEPLSAVSEDLYRSAAAHSRVTLVGEGGDVLFHPQTGPYLAWLLKRGHALRAAREVGDSLRTHGRLPQLLMGLRSKTWPRQNAASLLPDWIDRTFVNRCGLADRFSQFSAPKTAAYPFRPASAAFLEGNEWPAFFEAADPGATGIPLELRAPFFDLRLLTWALSLPPLPWCVDKWLLREAMRGILPDAVRLRPKAPLAMNPVVLKARAPSSRWLDDLKLDEQTREYVSPSRLFPIMPEVDDTQLMLKLRAVSLNYWLQSLRRVQYKRTPGGFL